MRGRAEGSKFNAFVAGETHVEPREIRIGVPSPPLGSNNNASAVGKRGGGGAHIIGERDGNEADLTTTVKVAG